MPYVLIADDHPICRAAVQLAAESVLPGVQVTEAATIHEAETMLAERSPFCFIVLDMMMPDALGFSGLSRILELAGESPVALMSSNDDPATVERALAMGATSFISKALPIKALAAELLSLSRKAPRAEWRALGEPGRREREDGDIVALFDALTSCQRRAVMELRDGALNKQIAHKLDVSEATVKSHLAAAFRKLGVSNRTQAVLLIRQYDLIMRRADAPLDS